MSASADTENLRIRRRLMHRLQQMTTARHLTQVQAAAWFHVSQPRVSHLMQNQVNRFSTDTLITMLSHAGVSVSLDFDESSVCGADYSAAGADESAAAPS